MGGPEEVQRCMYLEVDMADERTLVAEESHMVEEWTKVFAAVRRK